MSRISLNPTSGGAPLQFSKMSGAGNDFVVIDNRAALVREPGDLARRICTRRLSVGADGLILIEPSIRATFRMRYFNADGSEADFCANGTRCAARFGLMNVIAPRKMTIEAGLGIVGAEILEQQVTLTLPPPSAFEARRRLITSQERAIEASYLRIGVPHLVIFVGSDLWQYEIDALGAELRHHSDLAPDGANVNFVRVVDGRSIALRTWERGVEGETMACGSGIVAAATTAARFGRVGSPVRVLTRSGIEAEVQFDLTGSGESAALSNVRLTGDARLIYRSEITAETISGFDPEWVRKPTGSGPRP